MNNASRTHFVSQVSALVEQRLGLSREMSLSASLETIFFEVAGDQPAAYAEALRSSPEHSPVWQRLISALMIGETYFFRNQMQLEWLKQIILPEVTRLKRSGLSIWSAGCASGEEAYSLAITLHEKLPETQRRYLQLIATDINQTALRAAEQGIYRAWSFRHNDPALQNLYFKPVEGGWQIKDSIRQMVSFHLRNLLDGPPVSQLDVIICSNVLLYFDIKAIRRVEDMFFGALRPGGWLALGQAEGLHFERERWITHLFAGGVVYQKPLDARNAASTIYHHTPMQADKRATGKLVSATPYLDAVEALRLKQYDRAAATLTEYLTRQPNDSAARVLMGCILANRGLITEAHAELDTALRVNSLSADAYYLKGVLALEANQTHAALEALRSALYCQPGHPLAAMILGNLHVRDGDIQRARRTWEGALLFLEKLPPDEAVSDLSDLTNAGIGEFLRDQIQQLHTGG